MKRLPPLLVALLLLTSCRENSAMPDNRPASQEHPQTASDAVPTNEELSAYAEGHLAAYRYHDAAAWAYELKRQGVTLPPRLQQVLDEERYDPDAPVSTGSIYHLRPQQINLLWEKAENGDTAAAKRLWQYYSLSAEQTPENKREADYWDAKAGEGRQPK
ncbi:hypothetical protein [Neisseria elongata]|uniref:Lipoprotein n=1 Tax=Neisseria elongata subsp. nitroreducens TaxID=90367 RepID=A0A9X0ZUR5_NEIEL|nr:hypothetical protein [Neisseria elongata]MBS9341001.1 hypothetical protein [Neisseria elongata subsp. nitroreducens]